MMVTWIWKKATTPPPCFGGEVAKVRRQVHCSYIRHANSLCFDYNMANVIYAWNQIEFTEEDWFE
jgi:hypothetical protein